MTDYSHRFKTLETNAVHAGSPRPQHGGAVVHPIFQSANYLMADETEYDALRYIRLHNSPNHQALHARLAALEGAEAALVTASGMAAISAAMLAFVGQGDHVLTQSTLYGGTQSFLDHDAPRLGIESDAIDFRPGADASSWEAAVRPNSKLLLLESISNPLIEVVELEAAVAFAKRRGLLTMIDNTFASPVNFRPLEIGIDLVLHSATKYLNGHSDLVAGAAVGSEELVERVRQVQVHFGGSLDPHACFLLERGIKTLAVRVDRQNENAQAIAEWLENRREVRRVCYPGLTSDPGYAIAARLFSGCGGMLAFYLAEGVSVPRFFEALQVPIHAASLGGVESLVVQPARSSHLGLSEEERASLGITDDLVRMSVGIESRQELIDDLEAALAAAG